MSPSRRLASAALFLIAAAGPVAAATPDKPGSKPAAKAAAKPAAGKPKPKPAAKAGPGDVTRAQMQAEIKQVFNLADTNHDGFMDHKEFAVRMGAVLNRRPPGTTGAPTKEDAQALLTAADTAFNNLDKNKDGKLSLSEASAKALGAFDEMDTNHDGVLTLAEKRVAHGLPASPVGPQPADSGR